MTVPPGTGDQGDQADLPTPLRFASVARLASRWPVATLCQAMGVSRSGYYAWKDRLRRLAATNPRRVASDALCVAIQDCHARSQGTYGSPRIEADLIAHGIRCSRRNGRRARPGARGVGGPAHALPDARPGPHRLSSRALHRAHGRPCRPTAPPRPRLIPR